jgi:UDP-galactose transporter B1
MARTKQATPLRREPSSEYYSKGDATGTPSRSPRNLDKEINGSLIANGVANGTLSKSAVLDAKEAGAIQLLVALAGIYGSL